MAEPWWQRAVLYQVYPRSFADSNGDGIGDLPGVIERLDYLEWLGIGGVWLNPIYPSPNADWGYDVADYTGVHRELGTLDDVDRLIAEAEARGMKTVLDLVPGHSSDEHPWFSDPNKRDWYIWSNEPREGASVFGGTSWTERDGAWYFHAFHEKQPNLNWFNEDVRAAFDDILRFWFDRGVAGFRIDVTHDFVRDGEGNVRRDVVHEVLRRWRLLADSYDPPRVLIGETWIDDLAELMTFYGAGDELHMAFNFPFLFSPLDELEGAAARTEALLPEGAWPIWTLSNHDVVRFPTRMCGGDEECIRHALSILLSLRGTPVLYQGDELGMEQVDIPADRVRDVAGRDGCRTPLPWTRDGGWRDPWLPLGDTARNVADERRNTGSILALARRLAFERS